MIHKRKGARIPRGAGDPIKRGAVPIPQPTTEQLDLAADRLLAECFTLRRIFAGGETVAEREKIVRVALWEKAGRPWVGERIAGMQLVICQEGAAVDVDDPPARGLLSWRFIALRSMETGAGQKQAEEEPGPEPAGGDRQSAKTAVAKMPGPSHAAANNVLERIVELLPAALRVKICEAGSRDAQVALVTKALLHDSTLDTELAALDVLPLVASIAVGEGPSIDYFEVVDAVMAAAKPEPKKKSGGSGGKAPGSPKAHDPPAAPSAQATAFEIDPEFLSPNPFQPRHDFDSTALAELARSLQLDGQVQPVLVRPKPATSCPEPGLPGNEAHGTYEIGDGERRWRAAKIAGVRLMAFVRELSDEQMAKLALVANLQRQDLNPIEEAKQYELLIERFGYTQPRIGEEFGVAASSVCNRLRLLQLPPAWQEKIAAGVIPASQAKLAVPYVAYPKILAALMKLAKGSSLKQWEDALGRAVRENSRPIAGEAQLGDRGWVKVAFKPTDQELQALDVVNVKDWRGTVRAALNVELWDKLQLAGEQRRAEREAKTEAKHEANGRKPGGKSRGSSSKARPAKKVDTAALFRRRLDSWRINWLRYLCAQALRTPKNKSRGVGGATPDSPKASRSPQASAAPLKALLWLACELGDGFSSVEKWNRFNWRADVIEEVLGKRRTPISADLWKTLSAVKPEELPAAAVAIVAAMLYGDEGQECFFAGRVVEGLADDLAIDRLAAWRHELAGPLTEAYFNLHDKAQLAAIAAELGVHVDGSKPKSTLVSQLMASSQTKRKLPAELVGKKKSNRGAPAQKGKQR